MGLSVLSRVEGVETYQELFQICYISCMECAHISHNPEVSLVLVSPEEIQYLNSNYRDKNTVTDILSFPLWISQEDFSKEQVLGELFLCYNKAYEQALSLGVSIEEELAHLCIHGLWHLMGYDHIEESDYQAMNAQEVKSMKIVRSRYHFHT